MLMPSQPFWASLGWLPTFALSLRSRPCGCTGSLEAGGGGGALGAGSSREAMRRRSSSLRRASASAATRSASWRRLVGFGPRRRLGGLAALLVRLLGGLPLRCLGFLLAPPLRVQVGLLGSGALLARLHDRWPLLALLPARELVAAVGAAGDHQQRGGHANPASCRARGGGPGGVGGPGRPARRSRGLDGRFGSSTAAARAQTASAAAARPSAAGPRAGP